MNISDFRGTYTVESAAELEAIMGRRYEMGGAKVNSFWLCHSQRCPAISILVRDGMASLWYMTNEDQPGFVSAGTAEGEQQGGTTVFYLDKQPEEMNNDTIVSVCHAMRAAAEFLASQELPKSIGWREL